MLRTSFDHDWYVTGIGGRQDGAPLGPLTLPHDAMLFEARDPETKNGGNTGFFPGGHYRYSKTFPVAADWSDRTVTLEFEGVYRKSQVFVNGHLAGGRPSGYALFHVVLDEFLKYGATNTIEVTADTTDEPNSRWYTGSGIYRPVHLLIGDPVHVAPTGLRLRTQALIGTTAQVGLATTVVNTGTSDAKLDVIARFTRPDGTQLPPPPRPPSPWPPATAPPSNSRSPSPRPPCGLLTVPSCTP